MKCLIKGIKDIDLQRLMRGQLGEDDWEGIDNALGVLSSKNILLDDTPALTPSEVKARARRVQRFLSQPFHVAEQFTGIPGVLVDIRDTIKGFNMIMDGEVDHIPESAFNLKGTIEDAIAEGEKMLKEV